MHNNTKRGNDVYLRELSQTKTALGGNTTLAIVTDMNDESAKALFGQLWKQLFRFERRFSRFIPLSELMTFNRIAGLKTPVTPEFLQLLTAAKRIGVKTGGLYNPFITPALHRAGYIQSALTGHENDRQIDYSDRVVAGIDELEIGNNWVRIPYRTALDLGGCGKGYIADQLAKTLDTTAGVQSYWLSLGGDIAVCGHDQNDNNIYIDVQNANLNQPSEWVIECKGDYCGIATSGTFKRPSQDDKKAWHHIIDPSTMKPAETDIRLATVCANSVFEADVLASCAIILGSSRAPAFLKKHGVTSALLQCVDKNGGTFEKSFGNYIKQKVLNV